MRSTVVIIGAGTMGARIALKAMLAGHLVTLCDPFAAALDGARALATAEQDRPLLREGGTLAYARDYREAPREPDLVIEAVPEMLPLKQALFADLDAHFPPATILASNSSSLRMSQIESRVSLRGRVVNLHFFMTLLDRSIVEIMPGSATLPVVLTRAKDFVTSLGILPIMVRRDSTGFVFNRIWRAIKKESFEVVAQGVASPQDVDRAWMVMQNQTSGPFGRMDRIGLDVTLDIERAYHASSGRDEDVPPRFLVDMVDRGELGLKTGKGFYDYPDPAFARAGFLDGD